MTTGQQMVDAFRDVLREISHYEEALALLEWDSRTGAPRKGVDLRAETLGTLTAHVLQLQTSDQMAAYLDELSNLSVFNSLDSVTQAAVTESKRVLDRNRKVPADRQRAFRMLTSQGVAVWEEARANNDFSLFQPVLEKIVAMRIEFADYWGFEDNRYDTLLDIYEPGATVKQLDKVFGGLRTETVNLLKAIVDSGRQPDTSMLSRTYPPEGQRALSVKMLNRIGYDFAAGRLDETVHPFMTTINRFDNRVTTKYVPDDLRPALFGTIHEGGHALYEQNISTDLIGTPLSTGTSMGIHESQSRFFENMIGRSRQFWEGALPEAKQVFPSQLEGVSVDDFYTAINRVEPSLIRIEADELTYNLHIMIRYEIEKGLINGSMAVKDLPEIWNEKVRDYLGIVPDSNTNGVLQDVHWSAGDFGYFPSYALGNVYAAQFRHTMLRQIPNLYDQVKRGEFGQIRAWLTDHIHQYGKTLTPREIVVKATGEELDTKYLVAYLTEKYTDIYGL